MIPIIDLEWRVGRKLGRTIYAMVGAEASDQDHLIGMMDDSEIAHEVVSAHNLALDIRRKAGLA